MKKYLILNGPNLNKLGEREPGIYGEMSLSQIQNETEQKLKSYGVELEWFQSNHEGELIDKIQQVDAQDYAALIINPGGYSHTSVAIYDALKMVKKPVIETHLTNVHAREDFRQTMLTGKAASWIMTGLGKDAYTMAVLSEFLR